MIATRSNANPTGDIFSSILIGIFVFIISVAALLLPYFWAKGMTADLTAAYWTAIHTLTPVDAAVYKDREWLFEYFFAVQVISFFAAFFAGLSIYKSTTPEREIHIEGRQLLEGQEAVNKWHEMMDKEESWGGEGILICQTPDDDEITISEDRETKHTIIIGGIGSGKTTIIRPRVDAARKRGDKCLIYDNKSDFTSSLSNAKDILLVAPWDARGWGWDVAADITNKADAEAFASSVITSAKGADPMWANAARAIFTALIIRCQTQLPKKWRFSHILKILESDTEVQATVKKFTPIYSSLVEDMQSKTTTSILINLQSFLQAINNFATAWDICKVPNRFSIKNWLHGKGKEATKKTLIIQGNGEAEETQQALTQALVYAIKREVTSPRFTDVPPSERRINLFLDEFAQLGQVDGFATLLEVGRSKGIRLIVAIQDIHQLFEIYGKNVANTWLSSFGTFIIGKLSGIETTKYLSEMFGRKRIRVYSPSFTDNGDGRLTRSDSYQEQDRAVFSADEITRKLGTHESGCRLIIFTGDDYIYVVDAKHLTDEKNRIKRKPTVTARWMTDNFPTAVDVAIDNQIKNEDEQENEG